MDKKDWMSDDELYSYADDLEGTLSSILKNVNDALETIKTNDGGCSPTEVFKEIKRLCEALL